MCLSETWLRPQEQSLIETSLKRNARSSAVYRSYGLSKTWYVVAAPRLWNKLPLQIRDAKSVTIFRRKLKTYHFTLDLPP